MRDGQLVRRIVRINSSMNEMLISRMFLISFQLHGNAIIIFFKAENQEQINIVIQLKNNNNTDGMRMRRT